MTTTLESLKKEAREKFIANNLDGAATLDYVNDLITHVYKQAIEDAKGTLPRRMNEQGTHIESRRGWNDCRAEAITNLKALTKDV